MNGHDLYLAKKRGYLEGYADAMKVVMDAGAKEKAHKLAAFLARETFEDDETRRLVEGALRVER